ncbi:MAG TPA: hypothetical protein VEH04_10280 [Verrucomicrobiae bacterium]|nr:hypothetical protein [Verrucomicrobiae bacterium]
MQTTRFGTFKPALFALVIALLAGCATQRIDWESRVGNYTFDSAVLELGPPDKQATLQDGTTVAEWLTDRGGTIVYPSHYTRGYPYGYSVPMAPEIVETPNYYLRLTFDPERRLQSWKRFAR